MDHERSAGGSDILRHEPRDRDLEPTGGDPVLIEAISGHIERSFGDEGAVFHEIVSDVVHVDVHMVPPADERPWVTLVTSGMAERPMTVPEGMEDAQYAELVLALPPDWPLEQDALDDERNYWPIELLKTLARLPHEYETFLWYGHSVPNGDPAAPYAPGTELSGAVLLTPVLVPEGFENVTVSDGRVVSFIAPIPVYADEMKLKLDKGAEELAERLQAAGVTELVQPERPSVAARKRGLFRR